MQGANPRSLAVACTVGILIGNLPLFGVTTLLCFLIGLYFRLNQPVIQIVNQLMWVSHILLMPVFLRLGEQIAGVHQPVSLNPVVVAQIFWADLPLFLQNYGLAGLHALLGWMVVAPVAGLFCFHAFHWLFQKMRFDRLEKSQ
jgi:uncharacterized membrane protein YcfT